MHAAPAAAPLLLLGGLLGLSALLSACGTAPPAAVQALAPTGTLRSAINYGNPILANKDAAGQPTGVSVG